MTAIIAGLPMYDFPEIREATDGFWTLLADALRTRGIRNVPPRLERPQNLIKFWSNPNLLFGQTCGYPLSIGLCGKAQLVATPCYDAPGCEDYRHGSFLVVPKDRRLTSLSETQGLVCAINMRDSNTGMNLLRASIAKIGGKAPFYSKIIETGSHRKSLMMVARDEAQVAAIDCVSFAHFTKLEPALIEKIRVIGQTPLTPSLPFITSGETSAEYLDHLRGALIDLVRQTPRPPCLNTLMIRDIVILPPSAYDLILELERESARAGYPILA